MFEVEVKVRAGHGPVSERLAEIGADPVRAVRQVDTYYDAPDRSFAETDEALRIRRERPLEPGEESDPAATAGATVADPDSEPAAVLTYKGPKVEAGSKTREEVETPVDPDGMATVLDRLGYRAVATVEKERTVYTVEGYEVTLDAARGLGEFLEVETEAPEDRIDPAREGAHDLLDRLGLDPDDRITDSYLELLLAADAATDVDTGTDAHSETDADPDPDADSVADADSTTGPDPDPRSGTDADPDPAAGTDPDPGPGAGTDRDPEPDAGER